MIHILLVDDHPSVMEGTKLLLEQDGEMLVSFAHSASQTLEMTKEQSFDVMLIDLTMPDMNGIDLAKRVLAKSPEAKILIYTGNDFKNHFNLMIESGISGFVSKTANKEQLVTAVRCSLRGEAILPLDLVKQLRKSTLSPVSDSRDTEAVAISDKELEILKQVSSGKSNKEIAETLLMSQRSLEYGLTTLFHKLNVKSRFEAVMKAKKLNLLADNELEIHP